MLFHMILGLPYSFSPKLANVHRFPIAGSIRTPSDITSSSLSGRWSFVSSFTCNMILHETNAPSDKILLLKVSMGLFSSPIGTINIHQLLSCFIPICFPDIILTRPWRWNTFHHWHHLKLLPKFDPNGILSRMTCVTDSWPSDGIQGID